MFNREIGCQLPASSVEPALWMKIVLETFQEAGMIDHSTTLLNRQERMNAPGSNFCNEYVLVWHRLGQVISLVSTGTITCCCWCCWSVAVIPRVPVWCDGSAVLGVFSLAIEPDVAVGCSNWLLVLWVLCLWVLVFLCWLVFCQCRPGCSSLPVLLETLVWGSSSCFRPGSWEHLRECEQGMGLWLAGVTGWQGGDAFIVRWLLSGRGVL